MGDVEFTAAKARKMMRDVVGATVLVMKLSIPLFAWMVSACVLECGPCDDIVLFAVCLLLLLLMLMLLWFCCFCRCSRRSWRFYQLKVLLIASYMCWIAGLHVPASSVHSPGTGNGGTRELWDLLVPAAKRKLLLVLMQSSAILTNNG